MNGKDKRLYNYVVNTLGLSKQVVLDYVKERLDDIIQKEVSERIHNKLSSDQFNKLILNYVGNIVKNGVTTMDRYWGTATNTFDQIVYEAVRRAVQEKLDKEMTFELRVIHKDTKTVAKVSR